MNIGGSSYHFVVVPGGAVFTELWSPHLVLREKSIRVIVIPERVYILMGNICMPTFKFNIHY